MTLLLMLCHCQLQQGHIIRSQPIKHLQAYCLPEGRVLGQQSEVFIDSFSYKGGVNSI
jgi:hypothetical protein